MPMTSTKTQGRKGASTIAGAGKRACIALAAAAISAGGIGIVNAVPAHAACASWSVPDLKLVLNLVNGDTAFIDIAQNEPDKSNVLRQPGGKQYLGESEGGLSGSRVDVTVSWRAQFPDEDGNYGPRVNSHFTGYVGDDGFARGSALDNKGARVDWVSRDRFTCADKPPEPPPPAQQAAPQPPAEQAPAPKPVATVTGDVDLYDAPGGDGNVIGVLQAGNTVDFVGCRDDNWCEVNGGWVWGDFLQKP